MTIVSHRHKYIFLKTRKTAGTSVEALLAKYAGPDDILAISHDVTDNTTLSTQNTETARHSVGISGARRYVIRALQQKRITATLGFHQHMTAKEVKEAVRPDIWNNYTKMTIERNPYDRLISFWRWRTGWFQLDIPFESFALSALSANPWNRVKNKSHGFSNRPFYKFPTNKSICVDHVIPYENLESGLEKVAAIVGIPEGEVSKGIPTFKGSGSRYDLEQYYTDKVRSVAEKKFAFEAEVFDYKYSY
ncbi:sulfotransferase family 2 domain-containing protein [Spiribacter roseus]|uniref:sulfotransferase family 2 domain-containing protein n=1 Tax=Spiribacter roseus TaxID=1855875 RepID=UPI0011D13307